MRAGQGRASSQHSQTLAFPSSAARLHFSSLPHRSPHQAWDGPELPQLAHTTPTLSLPARLQTILAFPITIKPGFHARRRLSAPTMQIFFLL